MTVAMCGITPLKETKLLNLIYDLGTICVNTNKIKLFEAKLQIRKTISFLLMCGVQDSLSSCSKRMIFASNLGQLMVIHFFPWVKVEVEVMMVISALA